MESRVNQAVGVELEIRANLHLLGDCHFVLAERHL